MLRTEILERLRRFLREEMGLAENDMGAFAAMAEESIGEALAHAQAGLAASDASAVSEAAHGLKGGLRNMGLPDLAERAREMESLAANGDLPACRDIAAALSRELGLAETSTT